MLRVDFLPMKQTPSSSWHSYALLFFFLAVATAAYYPGLSGPFLFDDSIHISKNTQVQITDLSFESLQQAWNSSHARKLQKRPLAQLTFGINHALSGLSPFAYKATNLGIHLLNGLLVFFLTRQLIKSATFNQPTRLPPNRLNLFAVATAALWLVNPIHLSTVLYPVQRMTELSSLAVLIGLLCYVSGRLAIASSRRGLGLMILAFVIAAIGLLAKENAALFPLLIVVLELTLLRGLPVDRALTGVRIIQTLFIAAPLAIGLAYAISHPSLFGYETRPFDMLERGLTQTRVLFHYLGWMLIPTPDSLAFHHDDFPISRGLLDPPSTLAAVLGWLTLIIGTVALAKRRPASAFVVLFYLAAHTLESTLLPLEMVFEHRNYLASFSIFLGLAYLLIIAFDDSRNRRLLSLLCLVLAFLYSFVTTLRAIDWSDQTSFILSEVEHHPQSMRANFRAAQLLFDLAPQSSDPSALYLAAESHFKRVLELDPRQPNGLFGLIVLKLETQEIIPKSLIDTLEQELRSGKIGPTRLSITQFNYLLRLSRSERPSLHPQFMLRLLDATLENTGLHRFAKGSILNVKRAYLDEVMADPQRALPVAQQAAAKWPENWHYQLKLAELLSRLDRHAEAEKLLTQKFQTGLNKSEREQGVELLTIIQQRRTGTDLKPSQ